MYILQLKLPGKICNEDTRLNFLKLERKQIHHMNIFCIAQIANASFLVSNKGQPREPVLVTKAMFLTFNLC